MSYALVSWAGDSWVAVLRPFQKKVLGVEWEVGRGSVFGVPNPEEVGHRCDSRECAVGQEMKCLLLREGVAGPGRTEDGEGSEGREAGRGVRTACGKERIGELSSCPQSTSLPNKGVWLPRVELSLC